MDPKRDKTKKSFFKSMPWTKTKAGNLSKTTSANTKPFQQSDSPQGSVLSEPALHVAITPPDVSPTVAQHTDNEPPRVVCKERTAIPGSPVTLADAPSTSAAAVNDGMQSWKHEEPGCTKLSDLSHICSGSTQDTLETQSPSELNIAISGFQTTYKTFAKINKQFILLDDDMEEAFRVAQTEGDIRRAATTFSTGISIALEAVRKRKKLETGKWTTKLGTVLSKLYPVARLSLDLLGSIGDVFP
jgi:hypothetical protein